MVSSYFFLVSSAITYTGQSQRGHTPLLVVRGNVLNRNTSILCTATSSGHWCRIRRWRLSLICPDDEPIPLMCSGMTDTME